MASLDDILDDMLRSSMNYVECAVCHQKYKLLFLNLGIYRVNNEYFKDCYVCTYCLLGNNFFLCEYCNEWDKFENLEQVCINDEYMLMHKDEIEKYREWLNSHD